MILEKPMESRRNDLILKSVLKATLFKIRSPTSRSLDIGVKQKSLPYLEDFLTKSRWRDSNPRPADYKSAALAS